MRQQLYAVRDLREMLKSRGITLVLAGRKTEMLQWLGELGLSTSQYQDHIFPTLRQALKAYQRK